MNTSSARCRKRQVRTQRNTIQNTSSSSVSSEIILTQMTHEIKANILSLPDELLTRISFHLTLPEYSHLSRTCRILNSHFQRELILFLRHVYGRSVHSGSLILFAYGAHLQYRAPRLLDRIMDEFFVDSTNNIGYAYSGYLSISRQANTNSRWPTYWSVLYSLDKAPTLDPPQNYTCFSGDGACYLQPHQNMSNYKCASTQYNGSETISSSTNPKLEFLEKYVARMNSKFARCSAGSVEQSSNSDNNGRWHISDIREKKTYRMLIMQNIRYGDVDLLKFYLENYGAPVNGVVRFTPEEQVYLMQERELMELLDKHGIRVVVTE
ncbi:3388_t:CDS:2 [Diversispora eburnea]|uniref:3388_t:CDS:1 n=1 Tax=Diversispora eburnea TaxID=1213867 RepID=A0A9N8VGR3_9GLOM|nr:3388_t:CDS:2 [Diversispora eburnea]